MQYSMAAGEVEVIRQWSAHEFPKECCGLLSGKVTSSRTILTTLPVQNESSNPYRSFRITQGVRRNIQREERKKGRVLLGCFHSHTATLPVPTGGDRRSLWKPPVWIIYSCCYNELALYVWDGYDFIEHPLHHSPTSLGRDGGSVRAPSPATRRKLIRWDRR